MKYRQFGQLDWKVSALGFGCMRFPTVDGAIDEAEAIRMVRYAIDNGVTYFDTAEPYHGGNSEVVLGKALLDGYRDEVVLATKIPSWKVETAEDFDRFLDSQSAKLQTDYFDLYLLHSLDKKSWANMRDLGFLDWAEKRMAEGRFKRLAFSFHDDLETFKTIVDGYDNWAMAQIQYNYMNTEHQAGTEGLRYAHGKGLAVVVMEPLLGGRLANPPEPVQAAWDTAETKREGVDWALQWLWNQPEVSVALSGMSTMEQVEQNIASAEASAIDSLNADELALVERVREVYEKLSPIPCTSCKYCMPCPNEVNIPGVFGMYNTAVMYNQGEGQRGRYARMDEANRASSCIQCRLCEDLCPQHIPISEWMPEVDAALGQGAEFACKPA
jgi:uncharacterized protein